MSVLVLCYLHYCSSCNNYHFYYIIMKFLLFFLCSCKYQTVVPWCSGLACGHRGCQFDSSCLTFKTPLVRKTTGNHLVNSTSLEKELRALSLVSATLAIEYAMQCQYQTFLLVCLRFCIIVLPFSDCLKAFDIYLRSTQSVERRFTQEAALMG